MSRRGICGYRGWTFYQPGSASVVLCAAHGGSSAPQCLPDRRADDNGGDGQLEDGYSFRTNNDLYSLDLAQDLAAELTALGLEPHLVASMLRRTKLDANRPPEKACDCSSDALRGHRDYHAFIEEALSSCGSSPRLLIDIHGHGKRSALLELGYLLSSEALSAGDFNLSDSSLAAVELQSGCSAEDVVCGPLSLGAFVRELWKERMEDDPDLGDLEVLPSAPSQPNPAPGTTCYFSGGFSLRSWAGPHVAAVQAELSYDLRALGPRRDAIVSVLARAILRFYRDVLRAKELLTS